MFMKIELRFYAKSENDIKKKTNNQADDYFRYNQRWDVKINIFLNLPVSTTSRNKFLYRVDLFNLL